MIRRSVGKRFILVLGLCILLPCLLCRCAPPEQTAGRDDDNSAKVEASDNGRRPVAEPIVAKRDVSESIPVERDRPVQPRTQPSKTVVEKPVPPRRSRYRPVDAEVLSRAGLRRLSGKHITLYTDLPSSGPVDELPAVFDKALPQWCEYFGLDAAEHADWHVTGFLMKDRKAFERLGLMPIGDPPFRNGYSQDDRLWLNEQTGSYYRRHLLLHEGTHAFMNMLLGGCGPPWYMEGMAELFGTHRYENGRLETRFFPFDKKQVPMWGRTRMIADAIAAGREKTLQDVLAYGPTAHLDNEPYAWCWATAALLDRHPRYQTRFRQLYKNISRPDSNGADFNEWFRRLIGDDWANLMAQWQAFVAEIDYGYDLNRENIFLKPVEPLPQGGKTVRVDAGSGWQNSGVLLRAGQKYRLTASGRYQIAGEPIEDCNSSEPRAPSEEPGFVDGGMHLGATFFSNAKKPWWCEPGGVTIRYYRGQPLGKLLGVVYSAAAGAAAKNPNPIAENPFHHPIAIGLGTTITPRMDGVLLLKINDLPAELGDNAGCLELRTEPTALTD